LPIERSIGVISLRPSITNVEIADGKIILTLSTTVKTKDDSNGKLLGFAIAGAGRAHPVHRQSFRAL